MGFLDFLNPLNLGMKAGATVARKATGAAPSPEDLSLPTKMPTLQEFNDTSLKAANTILTGGGQAARGFAQGVEQIPAGLGGGLEVLGAGMKIANRIPVNPMLKAASSVFAPIQSGIVNPIMDQIIPKMDIKIDPLVQKGLKSTGEGIRIFGKTAKDFWNEQSNKGWESELNFDFKDRPVMATIRGAFQSAPLMLASMGVSAATGSPMLGAMTFFPSAASGTYDKLKSKGASEGDAIKGALIDATQQVILENLFLSTWMGNWAKGKNFAVRAATMALAEGPVEEGSQGLASNIIQELIIETQKQGYDIKEEWKSGRLVERLKEGLMQQALAGALMGGVTGGMPAGARAPQVAPESIMEGNRARMRTLQSKAAGTDVSTQQPFARVLTPAEQQELKDLEKIDKKTVTRTTAPWVQAAVDKAMGKDVQTYEIQDTQGGENLQAARPKNISNYEAPVFVINDESVTPEIKDTQSKDFKNWFGKSVMTETDNKNIPTVLWHGSDYTYESLKNKPTWLHSGDTSDQDAVDYAGRKNQKPFYVKLLNPYNARTRDEAEVDEIDRQLEAEGFLNIEDLSDTTKSNRDIFRDEYLHNPSLTTEQEKAWAAAALKRVRRDIDGLLLKYELLKKVDGKENEVNTDDFRLLFKEDGYDLINSNSFHEAASALSKVYLARLLQDGKAQGKTEVAFLAGAAGAGKSSSLKVLKGFDNKNYAAVVDGTLSGYWKQLPRIKALVSQGFKPTIIYVFRDPADAWADGVMQRVVPSDGKAPYDPRIIVLKNFLNDNRDLINNITKWTDIDGVKLFMINNSLGFRKQENLTVDQMKEIQKDYANDKYWSELKKEITNDSTRRYKKGEINSRQYAGILKGDESTVEQNIRKREGSKGYEAKAETISKAEVGAELSEKAYNEESDSSFGSVEIMDENITKVADDATSVAQIISENVRNRRAISDELRTKGFIDHRGIKIESQADIAELAAIFRHPSLERLQVIYVKDGVVVSHEVLSSGSPDAVAFNFKQQAIVSARAIKLGATQVYLAHNHPNGNYDPSKADKVITARIAEGKGIRAGRLGKLFAGHIILDHQSYSLIQANQTAGVITTTHKYKGGQKHIYTKGALKNLLPNIRVEKINFSVVSSKVADFAQSFVNNECDTIVFMDAAMRIVAMNNIQYGKNINDFINNKMSYYGVSDYYIVTSRTQKEFLPTADTKMPSGVRGIVFVAKTAYWQGVITALRPAQIAQEKNVFDKKGSPIPSSRLQASGAQVGVGANITVPLNPSLRDKLNQILNEKWVATREYMQDDWIRVRNLVRDPNARVTDESNPYIRETLFHGRVGERIESMKDEVKAIDQEIMRLAKSARVSDKNLYDAVNSLLIARHAPERNAIHGDGAAGMTTADAIQTRTDIEASPIGAAAIQMADKIAALNKKTLQILLQGQVIDQATYDLLQQKYPNHVPLQRIMEADEDVVQALTGKGYDVKGTGLRRAYGSDLEVADILTNITANVSQAITRAEKNRVDLATLKFARDNPDLGLFEEIKPRAIGKDFQGKIILEKITDPNVLVLREAGKPVYLKINDPHMALVFKGLIREKRTGLLNFVGAFSRMYASLATRFNPEFAFSNKLRDIQETLIYIASQKEMGGKAALGVLKADAQSLKDVTDSIRGKDTAGTRLYKQMREDGGTTGGMALSTRQQVELDIEKIQALNRAGKTKKATQALIQYIEAWNTIFEDSTRLSVYKAALARGLSRDQAAVFAKESSINFNKMGRGGPVINALYMFSNASIQGSAKMLRSMKNPKVAASVISIIGFTVAALAQWNDGVDKEWRKKVSKWDRMNSLVLVLPSSQGFRHVNIPIGWGIKPIKVSFDALYDYMAGEGKGFKEVSNMIASAVIDAYNPVGGTDFVSAIMPTALDMPVDIARNQKWSGSKIRPTEYNRYTPASIQYFQSLKETPQGKIFVAATKAAANAGIEVSPADINYAYEQLIGGTGRAIGKAVTTITDLASGKLPTAQNIPFVSRFYRTKTEEEVLGNIPKSDIGGIMGEAEKRKFYAKEAKQGRFTEEDLKRQQMAKAKKSYKKDMTTAIKELRKQGRHAEADKLIAERTANLQKINQRNNGFKSLAP